MPKFQKYVHWKSYNKSWRKCFNARYPNGKIKRVVEKIDYYDIYFINPNNEN